MPCHAERFWTFGDPHFSFRDHFLYRFSTFSEKMKKSIDQKFEFFFCKMHHRTPFLFSSLFTCAVVSNASWRVKFCENIENIWNFFSATDPLLQNETKIVCLTRVSHNLTAVKILKKNYRVENLRANVLKRLTGTSSMLS